MTLRVTMARMPRLVLVSLALSGALLGACSDPSPTAGRRAHTSSTASSVALPSTTPPDVCATEPVRAAPDPNRPRYRLRVDVRPNERVVTGDLAVTFIHDILTDRLPFPPLAERT